MATAPESDSDVLHEFLTGLVSQQRLTPAQAEAVQHETEQRGLRSGVVLVERGYLALSNLPPALRPPGPSPGPPLAPTRSALSDPKPKPQAMAKAQGPTALGASIEALRPDLQEALGDPNTQRLGRYLILGELGRGGMGIVHHAFDPVLRREVAIKQLISREGETADNLARRLRRFQFEGRAAAKLQHPLIVGVLEIGDEQGEPYLVMEFVPGRDLEVLLQDEDYPLRRRVEWIRDVAEALGHAHRHGIVHRDVKPGNVLIGEGRARLTDFGLARDTAIDTGLSRAGQIMGTPDFLSPEQAAGQVDKTRPSSDVFALGGLLYFALTGQPPFVGESFMELLTRIAGSDPIPPSRLSPTINRDLETIILRCLEKEQGDRYPDGAAVARDLQRFLAGEAIEARPLSGWERAVRLGKRNRALSGATLAFALTLLFGSVYSVWAIRAERDIARIERESALAAKRDADEARATEEEARREAEALAAASLVGQGDALLLSGQPIEATKTFNGATALFERIGRSPLSAELGLIAARRRIVSPLRHLSVHKGPSVGLAFAPDRRLYSAGVDGRVVEISLLGGELREIARGLGQLSAMVMSPTARWIAVGGGDGRVHLVSRRGGAARLLDTLEGGVEALAFSEDDRYLFAGSRTSIFTSWELASGQRAPTFAGREDVHLREVTGLAASTNYLWLGDAEGRLVRWNTPNGEIESTSVYWDYSRQWPKWLSRGPLRSLRSTRFAPQVVFSVGTRVHVWGHTRTLTNRTGRERVINNYAEHYQLDAHVAPVSDLAYVRGTDRLVTTGQDGRLFAWAIPWMSKPREDELPSRPKPLVEASVGKPVRSLGVSLDGALVATGSNDGTVSIWDLGLGVGLNTGAERTRLPLRFVDPATPPIRRTGKAVRHELGAIAIDPQGRLAVTGGHDGLLILFDARGGRRLERLSWHDAPILALELTEKRLVSICAGGWYRSWDLKSLSPARSADLGPASAAAVARGGEHFALGRADGSIEVFREGSPKPVWRLSGKGREAPRSLALSGDGTSALVSDGSRRVQYLSKDRPLQEFRVPQAPSALWVSSELALIGNVGGGLSIYTLPSGRLRAHRRVHAAEIQAIEVRGGRVFTACYDGSWQVLRQDSTTVRRFGSDLDSLHTLAVDQAGERVLVAGQEIELWDLGRVRAEASAREAERLVMDEAERALAHGRTLLKLGHLDGALVRLSASKDPKDTLEVALAAWELGRLELARRALDQACKSGSTPYLSRLDDALDRERAERCSLLGRVRGRVSDVVILQGGKRSLSVDSQGFVHLWDMENQRLLERAEARTRLSHVALGRAQTRFVIAGRLTVELWQLEPLRSLWRSAHPTNSGLTGLRLDPGGKYVYAFYRDRHLFVLSSKDGALVREIEIPADIRRPQGLAMSQTGKWLATALGQGDEVLLLGTSDGATRTLGEPARAGGLLGLTFVGEALVGLRRREGVWVRYSLWGELLSTSEARAGAYRDAAVDPSGRYGVAVTGHRSGGSIHVWDLTTGKLREQFSLGTSSTSLAVGADGAILIGGFRGRVLHRRLGPVR